jgi:RND superfamily putative drug exporter
LFFQFVLGQQLSWNVPGMAFLVLVAVGADYNLLLISRIREEAVGRGIRSGVIRTVGSTGGVITSAGLVFAASMLGLTASSISNVVQVGFIIGVGLLLDTFVVRTITVPAMAVIVGEANWWPAGRSAAKHRKVRQKRIARQQEDEAADEAAVEPLGEICVADACTIVKPVRTLRDYPLAQGNRVPAVASSSSSRAN